MSTDELQESSNEVDAREEEYLGTRAHPIDPKTGMVVDQPKKKKATRKKKASRKKKAPKKVEAPTLDKDIDELIDGLTKKKAKDKWKDGWNLNTRYTNQPAQAVMVLSRYFPTMKESDDFIDKAPKVFTSSEARDFIMSDDPLRFVFELLAGVKTPSDFFTFMNKVRAGEVELLRPIFDDLTHFSLGRGIADNGDKAIVITVKVICSDGLVEFNLNCNQAQLKSYVAKEYNV